MNFENLLPIITDGFVSYLSKFLTETGDIENKMENNTDRIIKCQVKLAKFNAKLAPIKIKK